MDNTSGPIFEGEAADNCGRIFLYQCDIKDMPLLPNDSIDSIVSVSALEHNCHDDFEKCMDEILRVTKPYGKLFITVSASQSEDWYHVPSQGWCYSEATIKKLLRLPDDIRSNFLQKDIFFEEMKVEGNELHRRLASFYFASGDNGMPWGKWDPQYQPVGIVKAKQPDSSGASVTKE
jgi:SAM-dependent methyltransferase